MKYWNSLSKVEKEAIQKRIQRPFAPVHGLKINKPFPRIEFPKNIMLPLKDMFTSIGIILAEILKTEKTKQN